MLYLFVSRRSVDLKDGVMLTEEIEQSFETNSQLRDQVGYCRLPIANCRFLENVRGHTIGNGLTVASGEAYIQR
jgi:hypothetical protein